VKRSGYRWAICALLFLATTINYIDRGVIGILKSTITHDLHWSEVAYADVVFWFQLFYAIGYAVAGRFIDKVGTRIGYAWAVGLWSLAATLHFAARSVVSFSVVRSLLGLAEGGNFPGATRATAEWFPRKERALAFGFLNAGSNVGAIVTPLAVPWITLRFGWPATFVVTGSLGFLWLIGWLTIYKSPSEASKVNAEELDLIQSDPAEPNVEIPWLRLLRYRPTWAAIFGMALTSPVWWFYLFWIPDFLGKTYHLDLTNIGPPLIAIYLMADVGSIVGGWISSRLISLGWPVGKSRKLAMLLAVLCVAPLLSVPGTSDLWRVTVLIGLAAAGHQAFSANLYTLVSDTMPKPTVSSVVGLAGMAGSVAGMFMAKFVGWLLDTTHSYTPVFLIAPAAYILALILISLLLPRYDQTITEEFAEEVPA